jgi:hypothetical protein
LILISDQALLGLAPGHHLWSYGIKKQREKEEAMLKSISPVVLRIWSYVNGLKEAPLQYSISATFTETKEIDPYL